MTTAVWSGRRGAGFDTETDLGWSHCSSYFFLIWMRELAETPSLLRSSPWIGSKCFSIVYVNMFVRSRFFLIYAFCRSIITIDNRVTVKFIDQCNQVIYLLEAVFYLECYFLKVYLFLGKILPEAPITNHK